MIPSVCPPARDNILSQIMAGPESPFTEAQLKEIILQHGKLGGPTRVRRWFMKQYKDIPNSRIPSARQFGKVMAELRATINSLAERMSPAEIRKAVNNVSKRAEACIAVSGDNFEHLLKKARRDVEE